MMILLFIFTLSNRLLEENTISISVESGAKHHKIEFMVLNVYSKKTAFTITVLFMLAIKAWVWS